MSSGFVVAPVQFSVAAFIVKDGDAGLFVLLQSRQSAAVATVVVAVFVNGIDWVACVIMVSVTAMGGWVPEGYAMAMISSTSCKAAAVILSTCAGLEIIWFIGFVLGVGYVWNWPCCL